MIWKYLDISYLFCHCTIQMMSIMPLTEIQTKILKFIKECRDNEGSSPTYREIARRFNYKSPRAAVDHVRALEKKGYLTRRSGLSRGISIILAIREPNRSTISVPILGYVPAGFPDEAIERFDGALEVDAKILRGSTGHKLFALRIKGDSMTGRGIYDGDWVVADVEALPREGDMVVALIDGENTIKTLSNDNKVYYLRAENPKYPDLTPLGELTIQGVVKAAFRRL
ncbi:MAG: transcriptional repressor LexA [Syntrophales bacterium]|nr:transcriptional repressor LexA [Syntrophales bacterium]